MSNEKVDIKDQFNADIVKSEEIKIRAEAQVLTLSLPKTNGPTNLIVNDEIILLPAGQPTAAIEASLPASITYGNIKRKFLTDDDPMVPGSINIIKE